MQVGRCACALDLGAPVAAAQIHGHRLLLLLEERLACAPMKPESK
jgi:hypothetical protein